MFEEILAFLASAVLPSGRKTVRSGVKSAIHAGLNVKDQLQDFYTEVKEEFDSNGHAKLEALPRRIDKPKP
jgi:hypothetical protein